MSKLTIVANIRANPNKIELVKAELEGLIPTAMFPRIAFCILLATASLGAQDLGGVVDTHIHVAPDVVPRSLDGLEAAEQAAKAGIRGIVLKNHYEPTVTIAVMARKATPSVAVFGGIALNRAVGGVNPAAVERMAQVQDGVGKVVWMPTFDSENQVRSGGQDRPFVSVSRDGKLLPEVLEVLDLIAKYDLALNTGHSTPEEVLLLVREAKERGVNRVLVTHAMMPPIHMTLPQMKQAAAMGAMLEFAYNGVIDEDGPLRYADYARAIREVGPDHCVLSTDMGQKGNPSPVDGMRLFLDRMHEEGISAADLDLMAKRNPARLLGLD